jgi:hypothetical protein
MTIEPDKKADIAAREFRIIGCGGRGYGEVDDSLPGEAKRKRIISAAKERDHLFASLYAIHAERRITSAMVGSKNGADKWIKAWCDSNGVPCAIELADWVKHGRPAGPIRNGVMLKKQQPHAVISAVGQNGTADMCDKATRAGVDVIKLGPPPN